jgi:GT2 family glycosyltransferase
MRSALVLGSGRSGTSMITGALQGAGYFQGDALHAARASNPKGFFESAEVNALNEALLAPMSSPAAGLRDGQRWLGVPMEGAQPVATPELAERIARLTARAPFCFKDPRFSFTLPAWRAALPSDTGFVCAFRHPVLTATSLVREVQSASYLAGVPFDLARAFELWTATYRAIVEREASRGDWLYVHYDQMLERAGRDRLAAFLDAAVDGAFPDPHLRRAMPALAAPAEALELYAELCARAGVSAGASERTLHAVAQPHDLAPRVAVLAWFGPGDAAHLEALRTDVADQRGVRAELVVLDATDGELDGAGAAPGTWSRCADLRRAALRTDAEWVALAVPGARWLPAHLAHALERLAADGKDLTTCDLLIADDQGRFVDRASPAAMGDVPGPFFEAGLVGRRSAFARLSDAAFFPGDLALWRALRAAGRATHVLEPGVAIEQRAYVAAWDRAQHDAALATFAPPREHRARGEAPELSVSLCTYNRRAVLRECLAGFARQLVAPGTFELVVTDDGSNDGTEDRLGRLPLPVPLVHVRQPNGGLAAARNAGLARARGRLVLFVNDDTIPAPDLVERHLARHAALDAAGESACVLGTFEQSRQALDNAFLRHLEGSNEVFGYVDLVPGEVYDGFRFWTCNVSAPLAAVRAAGGFDESFRHYGCEDTDLGFRLGARGLGVVYDPTARAEHRHAMDFDYVRRRARTVARAYVRFFRKHPALLERWGQDGLTARDCMRELAIGREDLVVREGALRELGRMNVGALLELEGEYASVARDVLAKIGELLPAANRLWWRAGYVDGLREHGLDGFPDLLAAGADPWPIASAAGRVLFAWPRWRDAASLDALFERVAPVADDGFATLLLRRDPASDPAPDEALSLLQAAWKRAFGPRGTDGDLEVSIEDRALGRPELLRLARSIDALLPLGAEPAEFLAAVGAERLETEHAVRAWRARFEGLPAPAADAESSADAADPRLAPTPPRRELGTPELSVIVPTRDRPRELIQLLDALRAQDLAPERFEVVVVDDGSRTPVEPLLARRAYPFALAVLAQPASGPGAARNRGVERARAETVVFFNDDAVPAPDCLRRHLLAHATSREPRAVLGAFRLLPRHCTDSFALAAERTTILFAQPRMKAGVRYHGLALCTGNVSLRRADLVRVGGFDERLVYAGGEDSELGLRLERELGLRVAYEPRAACGHDHALDVAGFAARRRIVGWSAYHIERIHPDAGLCNVESWDELAAEVERARPELDALVRFVSDVCARERAGELRLGTTPGVLARIERIGALEFQEGLLRAHRDELPVAPAVAIPALCVDSAPAALPAASPSSAVRAIAPRAARLVAVGAAPGAPSAAAPESSAPAPEPPRPAPPILPIAGPGAAASSGASWPGRPVAGHAPARGLRATPEWLQRDEEERERRRRAAGL